MKAPQTSPPKFTLSSADVIARTGLSRQRLGQLRAGFKQRKKRADGSVTEYTIAAVLAENVDWIWSRGDVLFAEHVVERLLARGADTR
ncbi:MAG TPA: hypothetical protein PK916_04710 [Bacteroidota bacterium]|nr:hypothetical protein [Bacteroidota bacterium]